MEETSGSWRELAVARVEAPHFVAGALLDVVVRDNGAIGADVVKAAPILKYTLGWSFGRLKNYCRKRQWTMTVLPPVLGES